MKKVWMGAITALMVASISVSAKEFPEREMLGVVMWGAGGATDTVARAINPAAEEALGKPIVVLNKSGGAGAISTAYVNAAPADGYTFLYGAENPQLHPVMGVADLDYSKFTPINILGRGVAVVVVPADSKYQTMAELMADIAANPGAVLMGSTGPGGLPSTIGALIANSAPFEVTAIPFDGEGPGLTAMLGGEVDFMPTGISAAAEQVKAGNMRALAVVNTEPVDTLPEAPAITDAIPEMANFLPWGPFYGVFVREDTSDDVVETLTAAFTTAAKNETFTTLMANRGNIVMNMSGDEAKDFLVKWQQVTAWALQDTGAAKVSPADLGIPRP
ncbi:MAG: tripartite tricarboxylate transporter substrate binding protein [Tateyamaria sp.]|jgi:tripartite-type tricarboxylate transporter receptor subunit TctC|nr:tripartite tricarboxylate transporter substrate binding protein [Tateyamaria sp.]MCH9746987.1 tripartite tricarboxylate transporter substrate binding protein [Alphaproteobacteria bacterium]MBT5300904.1 tripartite tricarboxylate transporter substrate binding protein [Tateyamaria sp.]MBT6267409.1 tripartite tricarboxylate transporter substrate binding protein [Tateyamaria sp.]MBT6342861.1 tripartite tricarboxylate transporter substrate binding protein [Tateyamaria sp.]